MAIDTPVLDRQAISTHNAQRKNSMRCQLSIIHALIKICPLTHYPHDATRWDVISVNNDPDDGLFPDSPKPSSNPILTCKPSKNIFWCLFNFCFAVTECINISKFAVQFWMAESNYTSKDMLLGNFGTHYGKLTPWRKYEDREKKNYINATTSDITFSCFTVYGSTWSQYVSLVILPFPPGGYKCHYVYQVFPNILWKH